MIYSHYQAIFWTYILHIEFESFGNLSPLSIMGKVEINQSDLINI